MKTRYSTIAALLIAWTLSPVRAGSVVTANLPAGDAIIEINGTTDGAAVFGGSTPPGVIGAGQDDWYQPFNTMGTLLEYTVQPGTYRFRIINQADAAAMFPSLTSSQLSGIGGGAWTYNTPWGTDYTVFDSSATNNPNEHQLFTGAVTPGAPVSGSTGWDGAGYANAADAYSAAILGGYYDEIVTGTGRYTGTLATSYTFTTAETLIFTVPDYALGDNNGVMSVLITSAAGTAVPEPASLLMATISAGIGLGLWQCRRRVNWA